MQICVSKDGHQWVTVFDYSTLKCLSTQKLFFTKMAIRSEVYCFSLKHLLCSHPLILEHLLNAMKYCCPIYMNRYVRIWQTHGKETTLRLDSCSYVSPVPYKFRDLVLSPIHVCLLTLLHSVLW